MQYDVIIPVATKECFFLHRTVSYIRKNLLEAQKVFIITNPRNNRFLRKKELLDDNVVIINENDLLADLDFAKVRNELGVYGIPKMTGWYFQQFLKLGFSKSKYARKYYLSWDADTLPLSKLSFDSDGCLIFDMKKEYHQPYFSPIKKLLNLDKVSDLSFIAEHMLFKRDVVCEMIDDISRKGGQSLNWWQTILASCDFSDSVNSFSEFEMYGTYCTSHYPDLYIQRQLATFRRGGLIRGRLISDEMLERMAFDLDTASFELNDAPPFPLSILHKGYVVYVKMMDKLLK